MTLLWFTMWSSVVLDHQPHCINNKLIKVNFMTCKHHLPNANWSHLWVWCSLAHDSSKSMWTAAHELRVWSKNDGISGHKIDHFATLLEAQLLGPRHRGCNACYATLAHPPFVGWDLATCRRWRGCWNVWAIFSLVMQSKSGSSQFVDAQWVKIAKPNLAETLKASSAYFAGVQVWNG